MLSYYYSKNTLPSNIDDFTPLTILQEQKDQMKILQSIERSKLTRENTFSEYYPLREDLKDFRDLKSLLIKLFTLNEFTKNKDNLFTLVIVRIDRDHFETVKEKLMETLIKEWKFPSLSKKFSEISCEKDQLLHVFYKIKDNK